MRLVSSALGAVRLYIDLRCKRYLNERGRFELSTKLNETAMSIYNSLEGQNSDLLLADMKTAELFVDLEMTRIDLTIRKSEKALEIRECAVVAGALEVDHPNRANSFMNLGVCVANDDPHRAIVLHKRALAIREGSGRYAMSRSKGCR